MFQRLITYIVGIMMFAIAGLVVAPVFIDLGKYKNDFSVVIKNLTGVAPIIDGKVNVRFFPSPGITIDGITITNVEGASSASILVADGVEAKFTFKSLIMGKFDPSSITLIRPRLELEQMADGDKNWLKLFEANKKSKINDALNIPLNINIQNGTITYRDGNNKTVIDYITANLNLESVQGPFLVVGDFLQGTTKVNFKGKIGSLTEKSAAELGVSSDSFNFIMKGNYRPGKNFDVQGTISLNVKDMSQFIAAFFIEDPLFAQIRTNENFAASGDFLVSNEITSFSKLTIDSNSIKGKGNIDMLYGAGKEGEVQWDISLNMDKINIDTLRAAKASTNIDNANYYTAGEGAINLGSYHFDLPTDISALFSLSIGEVIYNSDKLSNILIDTDIFNGKAIIHSFNAALPGNSKIELMGNIDHNGTRPLLIGKIKAYGDNLRKALIWLYPSYSFIPENELKEFLFSCDLNVTPRKMTISNIYGSVDKSLLNGSLFVRPSDTIPSIKAEIKLDRLDLDRYNATKQIDNLLRQFFANAKDLNTDTSWLKLFNYKLSLLVSGDEMVYNGNNIKNFSTAVGVVKGLMNVQNISLDSELAKLQGKINVDYNKEVPVINIDIVSKYFDSDAFILKEDIKEEQQTVSDDNNASIWSKKEFNLMGLERFNGTLNVAADTFKYNSIVLNSFGLNGELKKDIFTINEFKANWGDAGKINVKGSLGVSREAPSIGVSVMASAISIQDIFMIMGSKNATKGLIYIGGVVKTFGLSPYDWAKEFTTTAKISMRDVEMQGLDLPMIIEHSRALYSVIDMNSVIKSATSGGKTKFSAIDGNINASKSILQAKDFIIATDRSRGVFVGNVSLHNLKLKGLAKISYIPEANKQVTLGFNIEGAIPDTITYTLDSTNLEQYITSKANK